MSTDETDTTSSAPDADASPEATESGEAHSDETVEISKTDLADLAGLLESYRVVLIGHEERLLEHEGRITLLEQKKAVKLEIPKGRSR